MLLADLDVDRVHDHAGAKRTQNMTTLASHSDRTDTTMPGRAACEEEWCGEASGQRLELAERDPRALIRTMNEHLPGPPPSMLQKQRVHIDERA